MTRVAAFIFLLLLVPDRFFSERIRQRFVPPPQASPLVLPESKPDSFISPLDIPLTLAGNFGEPRKSHFHTGLDFRTNQMEGLNVRAVANGYVSRINVSGGGYGNALYITHPGGFTTVYAHLLEFKGKIAERLRTEQYAKESFAVDFNLPAGELPVNQGDIIALSGNTGGSGGPHLHFEIRDANEWPHNPMLYGYNLKDDKKPVIGFMKFYPQGALKNTAEGYRVRPSLVNGMYEIPSLLLVNDTVVGFSANAYDLINNTSNTMGIYNLTVFDNDKMVYDYRMDKLSFSDKRYVMSHVDYEIFMNEGRKSFHKCFVEPGNKCPTYSNLVNAGNIHLGDGKSHKITVEVTDFAGNASIVKFEMRYSRSATTFKPRNFNYTTLFSCNKPNTFETRDVKVNLPANCLFDDLYLNYNMSTPPDSNTTYSMIHRIGKSKDWVFDWFDVSLKTERLPNALADKAVVICKEDNGGAASKGGTFSNGMISARTRDFGTFYVKIDTTPPGIQALNVAPGKNMRVYKKLLFKIWDNLSGISDFDTYIDGEWTVTQYDQKSAMLTHHLDLSMPTGEHTFKVVVTDERKNRKEFSIKFMM